jgi:antitoxin ParD1/3/4
MPSSLHVSLPDEMRAFVDLRTNGKTTYATPSEYVRALIREDMEKESQRLYVFKTFLEAQEDIKAGRIFPDSVLDDIDKELDADIARDFE